jgi:ribose 5-phosphate isomerase B
MIQSIAVACDHAGFDFKLKMVDYLKKQGYHVIDVGCSGTESVDYPDYAALACRQLVEGKVQRALLICGSGVGMAISANKIAGIRAAALNEGLSVALARKHNDLNVLALGARLIGPAVAEHLVDIFLSTEFEGGRHSSRVQKIKSLESRTS